MRILPHRVDGTQPSFEEYHREHRDDLLALARSILGGDGAEDAAQEAWMLAWRDWARVRADPGPRMESIVRRCCEARRQGAVAAPGGPPAACAEDGDPGRGFEDDVVAGLDAALVWSLLGSFPPHLRDVLFLRGALDLTYAEIAQHQQVPMGTVMSRLYEARRRAQARLRNSRKLEYEAAGGERRRPPQPQNIRGFFP